MYKKCFKRVLDFMISLIIMPVVILMIIILSPAIFISDPGPVFYKAYRMGMNGKPFKMYKFRSMKVNSPDIRNEDGSTFNSEEDNRVTKFGKILRKTSLDEVPQILNVLKGDMSFIGPRPTLTTKPYEEDDDVLKKRITMRPGITGYSQAYFRNSITQEEKYKYDLYYIDNVNFFMDVKILLHTIKVVLFRENIYLK